MEGAAGPFPHGLVHIVSASRPHASLFGAVTPTAARPTLEHSAPPTRPTWTDIPVAPSSKPESAGNAQCNDPA
jgi:hypothetical protein